MKGIMLAVALLSLAGTAHAQTRATPCDPATPNNALCVSVEPPALDTAGLAIVLPLSYRFEQRVGTGPWVVVSASQSSPHYYARNLAPGLYTFRAWAIIQDRASPTSSPEGSGTVAPSTPTAPPAILVVQVLIGKDAPVFTVVGTDATRKAGTFAGYAAAGTPCEGPVLFTWRRFEWRKPTTWERWETAATASVAAPCAPSS
jgi:hypothetical protein